MAIDYSIAKLRNPLHEDDPMKWYAFLQYRGTLDIKEIAEHIAQYHGRLYDAEDIKHVAALFCKYAQDLLLDGYRLHLNGLGTLYLTSHGEGTATETEFTSRHIRHLCPTFTASSDFKEMVRQIKFRIVPNKTATKGTLRVKT